MLYQTKLQTISPDNPDEAIIAEAAEILRTGGLVAFPTETVYGLGADALNASAVKNVFTVKGRPADNPLIVHIGSIEQAEQLCLEITADAKLLMTRFWPGPLTVVLKARQVIPIVVTGGLDTVALRMPDHRVPLALIKKLGGGIVGPSANISGRPSPTTARHVYDDLNGKIPMILDAGPTIIGVESTVIDVTHKPGVILRMGGLPREEIEKIIGPVHTTADDHAKKRSPGTRYRHYAPKARVILVNQGDAEEAAELVRKYRGMDANVGCILHSISLRSVQNSGELRIFTFPSDDYAKRLFDTLRQLDAYGVDVIIVESIPETGVGAAVMDRLRRAAE
ncbi:MAG: L-threonylcarbamoyladenylate synthase [Bacteroidota bacterium]